MASKKIPQIHKSYYKYAALTASTVCLFVAYFFLNDVQQLLGIVLAIIVSHLIAELILRVFLFIEESFHLESRYGGNYKLLIEKVFNDHLCALVVGTMTAMVIITGVPNDIWPYLFLSAAVYIIQPFFKLKTAPIYETMQITSPDVVDIGMYMAVNYFYGYLKIVLPPNSTNDRGIKVLMEIYEAKEHITFVRKALYVLIPLSLHCPYRLSEKSKIIEEATSLNAIEEDRAGVKNRNYKNSVYKIQHDNGYYYVSAEYASPLTTFYESVNSDRMLGDHYKYHKNDILNKFYDTIKRLVKEDSSTRGLCEFILYDDENLDVGEVLLRRLNIDSRRDR